MVEEYLTDQLEPILSTDLLTYIAAIAKMFEQVETYITDQGDEWWQQAWSIMLDVDNAPVEALPYLSCFVGVDLPVGADEATMRALIRAQNAKKRGTPASIIMSAKAYLTGAQYTFLRERDGGAYYATLNVRASETDIPEGSYIVNRTNAALYPLIEALRQTKPAGVVLTLVVSPSVTIDELTGDIDSLTGTIDELI